MICFEMEQWSPYLVGFGIGVLSWISLLLSDRAIGCSTFYSRSSGMIERLFRGNNILDKPYYKEVPPVVTWDWILLFGVFAGAFLSAKLSGSFKIGWVPGLWQSSVGDSVFFRLGVAFIGGAVMAFGARWAGGCTSGHGISGTLQLAVSSWIAAMCFFAGGIVTAFLIFNIIFA